MSAQIPSVRPRFDAGILILNVNIIVNSLATMLTLVLIIYMRLNKSLKPNLYQTCVAWLSVSQLMLEISTPFVTKLCSPTSGNRLCTAIDFGFLSFGGCGVVFWSFLMICAVIFTVTTRRHPGNRAWSIVVLLSNILLLGFSVPLAVAAYHASDSIADLSILSDWLHAWDYIRLTFVGLNFALLLKLYYSARNFANANSQVSNSFYHLIRKIMWYPLIQSMSRIAGAAYTIAYGHLIYSFPEDAGGLQTFLFYLTVVVMPLAGIGNFIVFLLMTPDASKQLLNLLNCRCGAVGDSSEADQAQVNDDDKCETSSQSSRESNRSRARTLTTTSAKFSDTDSDNMSASEMSWMRMSNMDEVSLAHIYIQAYTEDYMSDRSDSIELSSSPPHFENSLPQINTPAHLTFLAETGKNPMFETRPHANLVFDK